MPSQIVPFASSTRKHCLRSVSPSISTSFLPHVPLPHCNSPYTNLTFASRRHVGLEAEGLEATAAEGPQHAEEATDAGYDGYNTGHEDALVCQVDGEGEREGEAVATRYAQGYALAESGTRAAATDRAEGRGGGEEGRG